MTRAFTWRVRMHPPPENTLYNAKYTPTVSILYGVRTTPFKVFVFNRTRRPNNPQTFTGIF